MNDEGGMEIHDIKLECLKIVVDMASADAMAAMPGVVFTKKPMIDQAKELYAWVTEKEPPPRATEITVIDGGKK